MTVQNNLLCESPLYKIIMEKLADRSVYFIFPSQAVTNAWAEFILRALPSDAAFEPERFISWDSYKEKIFSEHRKGMRASNNVIRTIWARLILAEHRKNPFLKDLLGDSKASSNFVSFLARIIPQLEKIYQQVARGKTGEFNFANYTVLYKRYSEFLQLKNIFEPSWHVKIAKNASIQYLLFAPELIEDFAEYAKEIEHEVFPLTQLLPFTLSANGEDILAQQTVQEYQNSFAELDANFAKIRALLLEGLSPHDIAISVANIEQSRPYIERLAAEHGLAIVFKQGLMLSESGFGRMLKNIMALHQNNFNFETMQTFLLDRFLRWQEKYQGLGDKLIDFGLRYHCYASYKNATKKIDIWEESFSTSRNSYGDNEALWQLSQFYTQLKKAVQRMAGAKSFEALSIALEEFRSQFLADKMRMDELTENADELLATDAAVIGRIIPELQELVNLEKELDLGKELGADALEIFLSQLERIQYVPATEKENAISIYPYRVAALLPVSHHFVLGADSAKTEIVYNRINFLRGDQKRSLEFQDSEATADFLRAYCLSPVTNFSFATQGYDGFCIRSHYFTNSAKVTGRAVSELNAETKLQNASNEAEIKFQENITQEKINQTNDPYRIVHDDLLKLSYSSISSYSKCHLLWLAKHQLYLRPIEQGMSFFDALLEGSILHKCIEYLFRQIAKISPTFLISKKEEYFKCIDSAIAMASENFIAHEGPFLAPLLEGFKPVIENRLRALIEYNLREENLVWQVGELEKKITVDYPDVGVKLEGTIDRVAQNAEDENQYLIIDYKRGNARSRAREAIINDNEELRDGQFACYIKLIEAANENNYVAAARYWGILDAQDACVIGEQVEDSKKKYPKSRENYDVELQNFDSTLSATAVGIKAGHYFELAQNSDDCVACDFKALCRRNYNVLRAHK